MTVFVFRVLLYGGGGGVCVLGGGRGRHRVYSHDILHFYPWLNERQAQGEMCLCAWVSMRVFKVGVCTCCLSATGRLIVFLALQSAFM